MPLRNTRANDALQFCEPDGTRPSVIALIKTEDIAKKILTAMHLPTEMPEPHPARPPRPPPGKTGDGHDWLN